MNRLSEYIVVKRSGHYGYLLARSIEGTQRYVTTRHHKVVLQDSQATAKVFKLDWQAWVWARENVERLPR